MTAHINGIEMYYDVHGSGEPVLFVHGFPLSGRLWRSVIDPLRERYRLVVPDLRGFGRSGVGVEASIARYADDLVGLLDVLDEQRPVVVVGFSMGGYVAFEFHRRHQSRVRGLALVDTRAEPDDEAGKLDREEQAKRVLREGSGVVADAMVEVLFGKQASTELRETWRGVMSTAPREGVAAALRAMARRADSRPLLATIEVPTVVVVGEDDAVTPPATARCLHEAVAGSKLAVIPGAGHMTPVEQPQRFTQVLLEFLDSLD